MKAYIVEPFDMHTTLQQVKASTGISTLLALPVQGTVLDILVHKVDFSMYEAKKTTENSYHQFKYVKNREFFNLLNILKIMYFTYLKARISKNSKL